MAKGHRSQIKRARNANKDTRPSAKISYARMSVQKACYVLDVIRGKDVQTALGILTYNPRYASSVIKKLLESAIANAENNNGMNPENLYIAECYEMCIRDRRCTHTGSILAVQASHDDCCDRQCMARHRIFYAELPVSP